MPMPLTTKFFQKKKKKNHDTEADLNPRPLVLEFNALPIRPLHYIGKLDNYKSFITNLAKKSSRPF